VLEPIDVGPRPLRVAFSGLVAVIGLGQAMAKSRKRRAPHGRNSVPAYRNIYQPMRGIGPSRLSRFTMGSLHNGRMIGYTSC
jgi:hypothetical protein